MTILLEILNTILLSFLKTLKAVFDAFISNIDSMLVLLKIRGYFTPAGIIAIYVGVPTFVIMLILITIKRCFLPKR